MKRLFPFPFLFLLVLGLVVVPEPVVASHEQDLENAATFLQNQYNQTLQLCAAAPWFAPDTYWLWNDNYFAYETLKYYNETMSNEIYSKIESYGYMKNYRIEACFGQTVELPFKSANFYTIEEGAGYTIKLDICNGSIISNWEDFGDLLVLAALIKYWQCWYDQQALDYFNKAAAMWDGKGIKDAAFEPFKYATYKLALLLYAERILGQSLSFHDTAESIIWQMQNSTNYGIQTNYDESFTPIGDVNVETTSMVIGAYKWTFKRSCPTPKVSPTRRASGDLAQSLMVLAIAMYLGTFLLRKNKRRWR